MVEWPFHRARIINNTEAHYMNGYFEWKLISTSLFNCLEIFYVCNLFCHLNVLQLENNGDDRAFVIYICVHDNLASSFGYTCILPVLNCHYFIHFSIYLI